jgi:hypothetical protein
VANHPNRSRRPRPADDHELYHRGQELYYQVGALSKYSAEDTGILLMAAAACWMEEFAAEDAVEEMLEKAPAVLRRFMAMHRQHLPPPEDETEALRTAETAGRA